MSAATTIPRIALEGYLKLVRIPLDRAVALLPDNGEGRGPAASLALDRADATVRAVAGSVLGDDALRKDAERRRTAADERERALRLHAEAERKAQAADERLSEQERSADRQRKQAEQQEQERRRQAKERREQKARAASKTEAKRRDSSRKVKAATDEAVEARAREARLDALETKSEALEEREEALTATDEARRLRETAERTKAARKAD